MTVMNNPVGLEARVFDEVVDGAVTATSGEAGA